MNNYAAVIYDPMNIIVRVEERPTWERAEKAGNFYTKRAGWWFQIVEGRELIEMSKRMINL